MSFLRELLNPVSSGPPSPAAARPSTPPPVHHHQLPYRSVEAVAPSNAQEAADTLTYFAKGGSNSPSNTHHHHHHHHHHNHHDHNNHQHDDDPGQASSSDTGGSSSPLPPVSPRRVQHPLPGNAVRAKSPLGGGVTEYIHPPTSSSPASSPSAASSSPPSVSPGAGSSERDAEGDEEDDFEMGNTGSSRHGQKAAAAAASSTTVVSTTAAATALPSSSPPVVRSLSPTVVATPAPLMPTQVLKPTMVATAAAAKPTKKRPAAGTVTAKKRTNAEKKGTTTTTTTATTGTTSATTTAKPQKKKRKIVQDPTSDVEDEILVATRPATTTTTKHTNKKHSHKDSNGSAHNHKHHAVAVAKTRAPSPVVPRALTPLPKFNDQGLELYCICRKPDSGKWMIGCDGCEDWFHGECIKVAEEDGDLIDKYYCPRCVLANHGITTWKRKCRLPTCRRPARTNLKPKPSKYCSPEHGVAFFALNTTRSTLPLPELSTLSTSVSTAREFHLLGDRMPTPPLSDEAMRDYPEELMRLKELEAERKSLDCKKGRLEMRLKYIHFANVRAKRIHEELKTSDSTTTTTAAATTTTTKTAAAAAASSKIGKEICGYDFRLGLDDLDWEEWCASPEGKDVFENGRIPGREEVCVKKKCAKHGTWLSMRFEEVALEERLCVERLGQVRSEEKKIKERQKRRGVRDSREGTVEVESVG